jgi:hypothetical protein
MAARLLLLGLLGTATALAAGPQPPPAQPVADSVTASTPRTFIFTPTDSLQAPRDSTHTRTPVPAAAAATVALPDSLTGKARRAPAPRDTTPFWHRNYLGLRVAWTLGDAPIFDVWQRSLPRTYAELGLGETLFVAHAADTDTIRLRNEVKQDANAYNVDFPVGLSLALATPRHNALTLDAQFAFQRKSYRALLRSRYDTLGARVNYEQSLGLYTASIGASWTQVIRGRYFRVDNTDRTGLTAGLALHPLVYLTKRSDVSRQSDKGGLFAADADSIRSRLAEWSAYGFGISWTVGGTILKKLSAKGGLETTLCYTGRWFTFAGIGEQALPAGATASGAGLSFVCHRFAIVLSVLRGRAAEGNVEQKTGSESKAAIEERGVSSEGRGAKGEEKPKAPPTP